jgi:exodeoxyribonuclease VIII
MSTATIERTKSATVGAPAPGIYQDIPAVEYHTWDAASNSALKHLLRSPAHFIEARTNPKPPTDAVILGTAVHTLILEPERFASEYIQAPEGDRRTKAVKEAWEQCERDFPGATFLKGDTYDAVQRIRDAVLSHPTASTLLALPGHTEASVVWTDAATGTTCKGRPDRLSALRAPVADHTTTDDASPAAFARSLFNLGYHRQAAHYTDGLAANDVAIRHFNFIVAEKSPPYGVAVYRLLDEAVEAGRAQLRSLLATYRWCQEHGEWPGYDTSIQDIGLPRWAWGSIEMEG